MSNRHGQAITWGTTTAPHIFTGKCTSYSYRKMLQRQVHDDEAGENVAITLHSKKAEVSFSAEVTSGSTDFLDLTGSAALIVVAGVTGGSLLASRVVETWRLQQRKTAQITATHYPDFTSTGSSAAINASAFTPDQSGIGINYPGGLLIYGTYGVTHGQGVVHGLTIEQQLTIAEDDPSPAGTILGAQTHGYMRTIQLDLLATGTIPDVGTVLTFTAGPANSADYRIESAEIRFEDKRGKMFAIGGVWIPPFTT